jgi:hypothetical protein
MLPFTAPRLDHAVIRADDLAAVVNSHRNVPGSKVVGRREDLGLVHLSACSSLIDLISVQGRLRLPSGPFFPGFVSGS